MTKERFVELVEKLNEKELQALIDGINGITHEYGWDEGLDDNDLILECWKA